MKADNDYTLLDIARGLGYAHSKDLLKAHDITASALSQLRARNEERYINRLKQIIISDRDITIDDLLNLKRD